jgi:hypothetical protein
MNGKSGPVSKWPSGEPPYQPKKWNSTVVSHNCYAYMLNDLTNDHRVTGKSQPGWAHKILKRNHMYGGINTLNCKETIHGVMKDNPDHMKAYSLSYGSKMKAPAYHYKGFLMVGPHEDFHFARQDNRMLRVYDAMIRNGSNLLDNKNFLSQLLFYSKKIIPEIYQYIPKSVKTTKGKLRFLFKNSKTWSHKPGSTPVTDKDADGNLIFDPLKANWNFNNKGGVNYSKNCCFFTIPMNGHKPTFSSGVGSTRVNINKQLRKNISTTNRHQKLDARVRKLLNV